MKVTFNSDSGSVGFANFTELAMAMNTTNPSHPKAKKSKTNSQSNTNPTCSSLSTKISFCDLLSQAASEADTETTLLARENIKTNKKSSKKARKAEKTKKMAEQSKFSQDIAQMIFGNTAPATTTLCTNNTSPNTTNKTYADATQGFMAALASTMDPVQSKVKFGAKSFAEVATTVLGAQKEKPNIPKLGHPDTKSKISANVELNNQVENSSRTKSPNDTPTLPNKKGPKQAWVQPSASLKVLEQPKKVWETQGRSKNTPVKVATNVKENAQKKVPETDTPKAWRKASSPRNPPAIVKDKAPITKVKNTAPKSTNSKTWGKGICDTQKATTAPSSSVKTKLATETSSVVKPKTYAEVTGGSSGFINPASGKTLPPTLTKVTKSAVTKPSVKTSPHTLANVSNVKTWSQSLSLSTKPISIKVTVKCLVYSTKKPQSTVTNGSPRKTPVKGNPSAKTPAKPPMAGVTLGVNHTVSHKISTNSSSSLREKNLLPLVTPAVIPEYVPEVDKDGFQLTHGRRCRTQQKSAKKTTEQAPKTSSSRSSSMDTPDAWRKACSSSKNALKIGNQPATGSNTVNSLKEKDDLVNTSQAMDVKSTPHSFESTSTPKIQMIKVESKAQGVIGRKSRKSLAGFLISAL